MTNAMFNLRTFPARLSPLRVSALFLGLAAIAGSVLQSSDASNQQGLQLPAKTSAVATAKENYFKRPLSFEANQGQAPSAVKYVARGNGYGLFLTGNEAVLALRKMSSQPQHPKERSPFKTSAAITDLKEETAQAAKDTAVLKMRVVGAKSNTQLQAETPLTSKSNYFVGDNPQQWTVNVPHFAQVRYAEIYQGVDLVYYGNQRELEYDFVVKPGANPAQIRLAFEGTQQIALEPNGELVLSTAIGEVRQHTPVLYQTINGVRQPVQGRYVALSHNEVGFEVAAYDSQRELVIDPVLVYSTYLGGSDNDYGNAIEADAAGNTYVAGITYSVDFPTKVPWQFSLRGIGNAFLAKFDTNGKLLYSTFLGGNSEDIGFALAADANGNAYLAGATDSSNFPVTSGAWQTTRRGRLEGYVSKLSPNGDNLLFSTYLGGQLDDTVNSLTLDVSNNVYITGQTLSNNFPVRNAWQTGIKGISDAFLTKLSADGSGAIYSTYLGGAGREVGFGVIADGSGNALVTGLSYSADFPVRNAFQAVSGGSVDAFVTKFNASGNALLYSTYVGGSLDDGGYGIGVDSAGNAYVSGFTTSTNFPTKSAVQAANRGGDDAFILKLDPNGVLGYSTYLGGSSEDRSFDLAVDSTGNAYVAGRTDSVNFPVLDAIQSKIGTGTGAAVVEQSRELRALSRVEAFGRDGLGLYASEYDPNTSVQNSTQQATAIVDGFVAKYGPDGKMLYSTFLGGGSEERVFAIALDNRGNAYVTGLTASYNFPIKNPAQGSLRGVADAFIAKLADSGNTQTTVSAASYTGATIAPDQIVSSFGTGLANDIRVATSLPLPTSIQNTEVHVEDSLGVDRVAPLFFISPTQINFAVPSATADGAARIMVLNNGAIVSNETIQVARVAPGLFSANSTGRDVMAGVLLRVKNNGQQTFEQLARFDASSGKFVPVPIEFGNDQLYLLAFGTGLRYRGGLPTVNAQVGGVQSDVLFAGAQGSLIGLDQINLALPRSLAGRGDVNVSLSVEGRAANTITINLK